MVIHRARILPLSALLALILALASATVAMAAGMTISIGPNGTILKPGNSTVNVPVTVTCSVNSVPGYSYTPASGTITVTLSQTFKGITTTGTGSTPVTCTGQPQSLVISVLAPSGSGFRSGAATVSASGSAYGTFDYQVGSCDATTGICTYQTVTQGYYDTGSAGPQPITLGTPD